MDLRVAGAQIPICDDVPTNTRTVLRCIDFAAREEAKILLTPEGALSGYRKRGDLDMPAIREGLETVRGMAAERGVGLALGTCFEEEDGRKYNQLRFYAPDGEYLGFHGKILLCSTVTEPGRGEAFHYSPGELRTFEFEGWTIGGLICNDLWASPPSTPGPDPHLTQRLSDMGAQIIFHAVNGKKPTDAWDREVARPYLESNLRIRARTGKLWVVTADNCHTPEGATASPSGVIDEHGNWRCRSMERGMQLFAHTLSPVALDAIEVA